jgi:hypothetical protein
MPLSSETGSGGLIKPKGQRSRPAYVWRLVLEFWISLLLVVEFSLSTLYLWTPYINMFRRADSSFLTITPT